MNTKITFNILFDAFDTFFDTPSGYPFLSIRDDVNAIKEFGSIFNDDKYPPMNIFHENNVYTIELAVAGFSKDQLNVALDGTLLIISTAKNEETIDDVAKNTRKTAIYRGLSKRQFTKHFVIPKNATIGDISLENGILTVKIIKEIPTVKEPIKLTIK